MDPQGTVIADWILAARRALAQGAAQRIDDSRSPADLVQQLADDIDHLAAALAIGRAELFEDHVAWCQSAPDKDLDRVANPRDRIQALHDELIATVPDSARARVATILERGARVASATPARAPSQLPADGPHAELALRYLHAILESHAHHAGDLVLAALDAGVDGTALLHEVVGPVQRELGRMWQLGEIDVATEHLGSRVAERLAILIHARTPRAARRGPFVVVCAVGGNQHDFAARLLADALDRAGIHTLLLGADTPPVEVARAAFHAKAPIVALSVALGTQVRIAELTVRAIRSLPQTATTKVIVGGGPFGRIDGLWRDIGADATAADVDHAVTTITAMLGAPAS